MFVKRLDPFDHYPGQGWVVSDHDYSLDDVSVGINQDELAVTERWLHR